jgi:hypothetical protein
MVTINIKKKDLWLLSAIMLFLVGIGFVIAYGSGGPASTIGHDADELEGVCKSDGTGCPSLGFTAFGSWQSGPPFVSGSTYTATNHGFVVAFVTSQNPIVGETPAGTVRVRNEHYLPGESGITMPVRSGDTWKVTNADTIYWIPLI